METYQAYVPVMMDGPLVRKVPKMLNTGTVDRHTEEIVVSQFGNQVTPGAQIPTVLTQYGYSKDAFITQFADKFSITRQLRLTAKNYELTIGKMLKDFTEVLPNRRELDLANRIGYAFVSSYQNLDGITVDTTCGDGQPVAASAHLLSGSPLTYSTIIPNNPQFSKGAVEVALKSAREQTYDNFGKPVYIDFNVIFCSPDPNTMNSIDELLKATADVTSSNAATFNSFGSSGQWGLRRFTIPFMNYRADGSMDTTKSKMW